MFNWFETSNPSNFMLEIFLARAQKGGGGLEWVSYWVREGALATRPLIPRKGLHHIVVSNCDDVKVNQVAVVVFVTFGFVGRFLFFRAQNLLSAFPFLKLWLENIHWSKLITCAWRTGPTLTDNDGKWTALDVILSALEVSSLLPYVNDDIANCTVYSLHKKRIFLNVLLPFTPLNFRGSRKPRKQQTRQWGDVFRIYMTWRKVGVGKEWWL